MGKDIENFSAELNSPVYFAGQLIQGTVHFDCSEPVKSEGIYKFSDMHRGYILYLLFWDNFNFLKLFLS